MSLQKQEHWLNQKQMAASLGISARAFQDWNIQPIAKIGREAFYDVLSVLENRLAHSPSGDNSDLAEERLRLTKAQAENLELKNEQLKGCVVPIEIIGLVLSRISGEAAGILDGIPLDIKRKHPSMDNQVIEDIKRHIVKAQNAVSRSSGILDKVLEEFINTIDIG